MPGTFTSTAARWLNAASLATIICSTAAHAQESPQIEYALPAQELAVSLRSVSVRSGTSIVAPADLLTGRRAPPLRGRFTAREAVEALIAGSGLQLERVGEALVLSDSQPVAGASETQRVVESPADAEGERIVVTGTNVRGARPSSQVLVIDRDEIEASGTTSVEQLMRKVPQNFQGGINQENFRVVGAGADPTEHGAGLNLRGLGQRATLVLVNGRRVAPSGVGSFVDVSLIPLSAIERVEILTDGASAIYGSDAVGGVVNFILRRDFNGLETVLQAGTATRGDGDQLVAGVTAGRSWAGGSAMLSYEYRHDDEILARDLDFTINLAPDTALIPRERRHSLFGVFRQELADRLEFEATGTFARRRTRRPYFFFGNPLRVEADAEARATSIAANLAWRPGSDWLIQLSGGYSRSWTDQEQTQPGGEGLVNRLETENEILDAGLKADGTLFSLPGGPVRAALGAQWRRESYLDIFETRTSPADERTIDRTVRALFGELYVPLVSPLNRSEGLERLILSAALRYEHYDRFGGSFDPRLGILWSPLPGLSLRGSYGTSFRAPLLSEAIGAYNAFYLPAALLTVAPPVPAGVALALGGSNPDIGPERSTSWTAGAEWEPAFAPGLVVRGNYYAIRFFDRIALPAPTIAVIGNPAFDPIVTLNPPLERVVELIEGANLVFDASGPGFSNGGATPEDVGVIVDNRFGNTSASATSGIDLGLRYAFETSGHRFWADLNANYIFDFEDRLTSSAPAIDALNRPYRPVDLRARAGLGWSAGRWSANLFVNYVDDYRDDRRTPAVEVDSFTTVDASVAFSQETSLPGGFRVALAVQNLFDADPPRLLPEPNATVGFGYDPVNASGRGRIVLLQLRKSW